MRRIVLVLAFIVFIVAQSIAQVTIGSGSPPHQGALLDLKENEDGSSEKGLLLPRVKLVNTDDPSPFSEHTEGMYVFNTASTGDVTPGNYFNDGTKWFRVGDINSEPWFGTDTGVGATNNTENIYQMGQVGIGGETIDPNAQLQISSTTRGVLIPRLTTQQRNQISAEIANGLLIYNTTTNCFNYYDSNLSRWMSMCGNFDPATMNLISCDPPSGSTGDYTQGKSLTTDNTYTVIINVSEPGTYTITARTNNGYTFSKSGTFTETGRYTVTMEGQGAPANGPQTDVVAILFNGIEIVPICTLPTISVLGATTAFTITCNNETVNGTYQDGIIMGTENYIDIPIDNVITPGSTLIETLTVNGVKFSSGSTEINSGSTYVRLYASGTPTLTGTYTYSITAPGGGNTCTFDVNVTSSLGTWKTPAISCKQLLDQNGSLQDGMYYVQGVNGAATKTWCDMTNGGWTLIWSRSEAMDRSMAGSSTGLSVNGTNRLNYNSPRGLDAATATSAETDLTTTIDPLNYRLPLSSITAIQNFYTTTREWKVRIIEDQDNSFNHNDAWGNDNYQIINTTASSRDFLSTAAYANDAFPFTGKLWGATFNAVNGSSSSNLNITINGTTVATNSIYGWYHSYATYANDILNFGPGALNNNTTITYTAGGVTTTVNPSTINDLWSQYIETQLNHHWGKCSTSGAPDYGGATNCGYGSFVPHSFNGGQGRIMQWFVK